MHVLQQLLFIIALGLAGNLILRRAILIRDTIRLGRAEKLTDQPGTRFKTMMRIAFAQKKMFDRPLAGILHFVVYAGFILINIEVLEIVLDGLFGTHRMFAPHLGSFYTFLIGFYELLAIGVILACIAFLFRRNDRVPRLTPVLHRELRGWPALDGKLILTFEIILMLAVLFMNAADLALQRQEHFAYPQTGNFIISGTLANFIDSWDTTPLLILERFAWWVHILGILAFAVYITYSKHLHILLAFPNTYFTPLRPRGKMENMPEITKEVKIMLGLEQDSGSTSPTEIGSFGAKDVTDLSWKNLLDAYSCTECGRCTSLCPANLTGKLLSPRKIMMDTRDRLEELGENIRINGKDLKEDGKSLLGDYILEEEILACTTCNACVEACPILINPLDIILQLRRYKIMDEAKAPGSWNMMFQNLETNQAPWKFAPSDRFNWANDLNKDDDQ